jgi:hypothetical protein
MPNQFRRSSAKNNVFCLLIWVNVGVKFDIKACYNLEDKYYQSSQERQEYKEQCAIAPVKMATLKERLCSQNVGDEI